MQLTQEHQQLLDDILDALIPANKAQNIPSAAALGGVKDFILKHAENNQDFEKQLTHILTNIEADALVDSLKKMETSFHQEFQALLRLTYMGYYSRPEIRVLFGLSNKPTQPDGYDVPSDEALLANLTASVVARGACYLKC
ncbi:MAG: hypothetical protein K0U45_09695 [Alphaproteobacteria bacterium]|nr:hypothetical protein [Alphaproteobacteria bacterium]